MTSYRYTVLQMAASGSPIETGAHPTGVNNDSRTEAARVRFPGGHEHDNKHTH